MRCSPGAVMRDDIYNRFARMIGYPTLPCESCGNYSEHVRLCDNQMCVICCDNSKGLI